MTKHEFSHIRKLLQKTQKQMSQLLGISLKAIHSYEQGWRNIPVHVERQLMFLVSKKVSVGNSRKPCWEALKCQEDQRNQCPAWEFRTGDLCWFINGTICEGVTHKTWKDKMAMCRSCEMFTSMMGDYMQEM